MSNIKDGGSVFTLTASEYGGHGAEWGMSLRDYFAAKAMQCFLSGPDRDQFTSEQWAYDSYKMADSMLAQRDK